MKKLYKTAAIGIAAASMATAAPASATIFEYTFGNGDVLTIDNETGEGSWVGEKIDATFTGDFSEFQGGDSPSFMTTLTSLDGSRLINGTWQPVASDPRHPEMLKTHDDGAKWNLWANWGDPIVGGDYVRRIASYTETDVPAPGMLGLFGMALAALGLGWRRRKANAAA